VKKIVAALIILVVTVSSLKAQDYRKGYIIKNDGDSIVGFVAYRALNKNFDKCSFKVARMRSATKYTPAEIMRYGFIGDKVYESITLPKNSERQGRVFAKKLSDGPLKLFGYRNVFLIQKDSLILLPLPTDRLVDLKDGDPSKVVQTNDAITISRSGAGMLMRDKRYVGIMNHFLEDCKLSAENAAYTETDLRNVVNNYNRCKGVKIASTGSKSSFQISPRIFVGGMQSNLRLIEFPRNTFAASRGVFFGGGFDISSPRSFDRSFLSLELQYAEIFYQGYSQSVYLGDYLRRDIFIDLSYFKVPIAFKYNFAHSANSPYVKIGLAFFLKHNPRIRTFEERQAPNNVIYSEKFDGGYAIRTPKSIWIAAGYEKTIVGRFTIFAEARIEQNNGFIGNIFTGYSSARDLNILLGLKF
jgi:hypothetical protein